MAGERIERSLLCMDVFRNKWCVLPTARKATVVLMVAASVMMIASRLFSVSVFVSGILWVLSLGFVVGAAILSLRRGHSQSFK